MVECFIPYFEKTYFPSFFDLYVCFASGLEDANQSQAFLAIAEEFMLGLGPGVCAEEGLDYFIWEKRAEGRGNLLLLAFGMNVLY